MNPKIEPHDWIRSGASVLLARFARVRSEPAGGGKRLTTIDLAVEEALYGPRGEASRRVLLLEPESPLARAKFPAPQWGAVTLVPGALVLLATAELGEELGALFYVDPVERADDPLLDELRGVLAAEASSTDPAARRARYLGWLASGEPIHALFAGAALARDADLPDVDPRGEVAAAFGRAMGAAADPEVRMKLVAWMGSTLLARTNAAGRTALINAFLRGAADPSEGVRRLCLDALSEVDPNDLGVPGIVRVAAAAPFLEARIEEETAPELQARLKEIASHLRG
jgi:hypothetical protein